MIILSLRSILFWGISFLLDIILLNVHCVYVLILITTNVILIFSSSFFTMSVILNHLFKICDLTYWAIVVLSRILLCKALDLWSGTYFRNVWFLCTASLFIWNTSSSMSSFNKMRNLIILLIKIFQHLRSCHLWSLSSFSKNLRSTFNHLFDWILSFFMILSLVILLIWIWLGNIVSKLSTMMMSMKIALGVTSFFLDWVVNLSHQLVTLMSSKAFIFNHASLIAVVIAHDSWCSYLFDRWLLSCSWSKSIFLHLWVLVEVEAFSWLVSFIWLLNKLVRVSSISCVWSSAVVVA